jgi:hypothetical protein
MAWNKRLRDKFDLHSVTFQGIRYNFSQFSKIYHALSNRRIQNVSVKSICPLRAADPILSRVTALFYSPFNVGEIPYLLKKEISA